MTDPDRVDDACRHAIEEQAVAWFMNIRARRPDADRSDLVAWLEQSAEHRRAYERAQRHYDTTAILKSSRRHGSKRAGSMRPWLIGIGIAAAFVLAIALSATFRPGRDSQEANNQMPGHPLIRAPKHQIRDVTLGDGTQLTLDASSRVEVAVTAKERRLKLLEGTARIAVKREARPFIVEAGVGEASALAATFDIGMADHGQIEVAVLSGEVELRSLLRPAVLRGNTRKVQSGQATAYIASTFAPSAVEREGIDRADWPDGWADYEATPLARLISDANRYARRPIVLDDSDLGKLLVSGHFRITETDRFAERIASLFDLALKRTADNIHLRKR